jgi:hypothetical protein
MAATRTAKKTTTPAKKVVVPRKRVATKQNAAELHAYIPDSSVAEKYVNREVFGTWDATIAGIGMKNAQNILLQGPTGAGKTMFGEAFAAKWRYLYYSLPCDVSIDPGALFGRRVPGERAGEFPWQDGPVTQIFREGGVLNVSEVNFMSPKIAASLYPALDGRRYIPLIQHNGEIVRAHLGTKGKRQCWCDLSDRECNKRRVLIIADMNPQYRGTMNLNEAFLNRWEFKLPWNYDKKVEEQLVHFPTLRDVAEKLRASDDVQSPVSTNVLMEFESFAVEPKLGIDFANENFINAFMTDEQAPVRRVMELNMTNLKKDLRHFKSVGVQVKDEELEEIEFEQEEE